MNRKVLNIGPSVNKSFGGMVTVLNQIKNSERINEQFTIELFSSYVDGSYFKRAIYSVFKCLAFFLNKKWKKYDIFHLHTASFTSTYRKMFLSKLIKKHGKKYIIHIHGAEYLDFYNSLSVRKKDKIKNFLNSASYVIVLSNYWKEIFEQVIGINNCIVVNNCIDYNHYSRLSMENNSMRIKFLYLGRIGKRKGMWDIIEVSKKMIKEGFEFEILVAGDGEIDKYNELIKQNNLANHFKYYGWADSKLKDELLSISNVLILPSYNEGLPMSILEAMAAGKVILSSNVGGIPEVVIDGINGYIVQPGNIDELYEKMCKCFDQKKNIEISQCNKDRIKSKFDISVFEDKIINIYTEVTKND